MLFRGIGRQIRNRMKLVKLLFLMFFIFNFSLVAVGRISARNEGVTLIC